MFTSYSGQRQIREQTVTETDRDAIVQVINLYGLAIDSRRWDLFDRVFTADVEARYGKERHWHDLKSFKQAFEASHQPFHHTQHAMMNHIVHIAGNDAQAFTYVSWRLILRNSSHEDVREGSAWYDDLLLRSNGTWLIRKRECKVTWARRTIVDRATLLEMEAQQPTAQVRDEARKGAVPVLSIL